jgi:CRISPR-associated protein Cmr1
MTRNDTLPDPKQVLEAWKKTTSLSKTHQFKAKTITPLFGGGVVAGEVDMEMPVRASSIRGQLRFWWRLLNGKGLSSPELFKKETALWGGISSTTPTASRVAVRVHLEKAMGLNDRIESTKAGSAYALFPARDKDSMLLKPGIQFNLRIDCPDERWQEVKETLRWWITFGGIGSRARRGLGAIEATGLTPVSAEEVETQGGRLLLSGSFLNAQEAWYRAIDRLKDFRQGENTGRNPGKQPNRPGRSRWPEPDNIRRLTRKHDSNHAPEHQVQDYWPRAAFGLPIVFHFQSKRDPDETNLEPHGDHDRMASPLILRPYSLGENKYAAAALLLPGWENALKTDLELKGTNHKMLQAWPGSPAKRQDTANKIKPMQGRGDDPLSAFMTFFAQGGKS